MLDFPEKWLGFFIKTGGVDQLLKIYRVLIEQLPAPTSVTDIEQVTECIGLLLKLLAFALRVTRKDFDDTMMVTDHKLFLSVRQIISSDKEVKFTWLEDPTSGIYLIRTIFNTLMWASRLKYANQYKGFLVSNLISYCFDLLQTLHDEKKESQVFFSSLEKELSVTFKELLFCTSKLVRDRAATGIYYFAVGAKLDKLILQIILALEPSREINTESFTRNNSGEYYDLL